MPVITLPTPGVTVGPTWASMLVTAITDVNTQVDTDAASIATKAPTASPTFTGTPAAPTAAPGTNTTQLATTAFVTAAANQKINLSVATTKGDLLVATGSGVFVRQGVGTNGQVLTADSTQADGVIWATPSGGGGGAGIPEPINPASGNYKVYRATSQVIYGTGTLTLSANPSVTTFQISQACSIRSLAFQIAAAGTAGNTIEVWLYKASGTTGMVPDTLVYDFGSVAGDATSNGMIITPGTPVALTAGTYSFLIGDTTATTHAGIVGTNTTVGDPVNLYGRTAESMGRLDLIIRGGSQAVGLTIGSAAPSTIAWSTSGAGSPRVENVSGGRMPLIWMDLI